MKSRLRGSAAVPPVASMVVALLAGCTAAPVGAAVPPTRSVQVLSPVYEVDREYRSMTGPQSTQTVSLPAHDPPELVWITGYRAEMTGADGETPMSQAFMCHSNLDFDAVRHARRHDLPVYHTDRLFTLSQGQLEIRLPRGFGLPFYTDEELELTSQVLDLNPSGEAHEVRQRVTIEYVMDRDLEEPMTPLFMTSGWGLVLLEGDAGYFNVVHPSQEEHGPGCLPGDGGVRRRPDGHRRKDLLRTLGRPARARGQPDAGDPDDGAPVRHDAPLCRRPLASVRRVARALRRHGRSDGVREPCPRLRGSDRHRARGALLQRGGAFPCMPITSTP